MVVSISTDGGRDTTNRCKRPSAAVSLPEAGQSVSKVCGLGGGTDASSCSGGVLREVLLEVLCAARTGGGFMGFSSHGPL